VDVPTFIESFREFRTAPVPLIQKALNEACLEIAPEQYGDLTVTAVGYQTAHILANTPFGQSLRLAGKVTTWSDRLDEIKKQVLVHIIVI
jgi:hypothetical protein